MFSSLVCTGTVLLFVTCGAIARPADQFSSESPPDVRPQPTESLERQIGSVPLYMLAQREGDGDVRNGRVQSSSDELVKPANLIESRQSLTDPVTGQTEQTIGQFQTVPSRDFGATNAGYPYQQLNPMMMGREKQEQSSLLPEGSVDDVNVRLHQRKQRSDYPFRLHPYYVYDYFYPYYPYYGDYYPDYDVDIDFELYDPPYYYYY